MNVSLCMIVRNEEANLEACLRSVSGLIQEAIVVDTGSDDGTKDIARRHGARVFEFPWRDDFAAARNESLERASGDWVFWLDADDRVEAESHARLAALFASLQDTRDGYMMRCVSLGAGRVPAQEVAHLRLFRNDPRLRFRYRVHEQVAPAVRRVGGELLDTDIVIRHEGYVDPVVYRRKQERNLRLIELECAERPLDPFMLYYRGAVLLDLDRAAEAIVSLQLCASLVPRGTSVARALPLHLAEAYSSEGLDHDALVALSSAHAAYPEDVDLAFALATHLYRAGDLAAAERELAALASAAPRAPLADRDPSIAAFRARHLRAAVRFALGRYDEAEADARAVVEACADFGEGWLLLCDALGAQQKERELEGVIAELEQVPETESSRVLIAASRRARSGDRAGARQLVDEGLSAEAGQPFLLRAKERLGRGGGEPWRIAAYFLSTKDLPAAGAPPFLPWLACR